MYYVVELISLNKMSHIITISMHDIKYKKYALSFLSWVEIKNN